MKAIIYSISSNKVFVEIDDNIKAFLPEAKKIKLENLPKHSLTWSTGDFLIIVVFNGIDIFSVLDNLYDWSWTSCKKEEIFFADSKNYSVAEIILPKDKEIIEIFLKKKRFISKLWNRVENFSHFQE